MPILSRAALATLSIAGLTGVAAAPAAAAPPWSAPVPVPGERYQPLSLSLAGDGTGVLAAPAAVPFDADRRFEPTRLTTITASGAVEDRGTLRGSGLAAPPLTYGRDRVVLVSSRVVRPGSFTSPRRVRLSASFGTTDRPDSGRRQVLADPVIGSVATFPVDAAATSDGRVAIAWVETRRIEDEPFQSSRLRLSVRRPGGRFARPITLRTGSSIEPVRVVWGPRGDLLVAFTRVLSGRERRAAGSRAVLEARVRRAGRSLGPVQRVGPSRGSDAVSAAVAPNGSMAVAWGTHDPGIEVNEPYEIRTAVRPAGARRFREPQLLDDGGGADRPGGTFGDVRVAMARDGRATVAYTARRPLGQERFAYPVFTATAGAAGRFGAPRQLAPEGALAGLAVRPDGAAVAVWSSLAEETGEGEPGIRAAVRAVGAAAFGAPETITDAERTGGVALALGPDGAPVVAYTSSEPSPGITRFTASITRRPPP